MPLFELSAALTMNTSQYDQALSRAEKNGQKASQKLGNSMKKMGSTASNIAGKTKDAVSSAGNLLTGISDKVTAGFNGIVSISSKAASGIGTMAKFGVKSIGKVADVAVGLTKQIEEIGKTAVKAAGIAGAAVAAISTPVIKGATKAYASFEQLEGGVQTLFKNAWYLVMQDAEHAYELAGMSTNEYLDMVTSFSASMIQSLDGDVEMAAYLSKQAIIDMSDNANKMGTDMESIQNAYRGFSKQNYMMLDNLKLGYGGTRKEMERLLADAEKISGVHYDIESFSDVVKAVHVIQTELGIAGTTKKEAESTIEGSAKAAKAAWNNLLLEMGKPSSKRNIQSAVKVFTDTAKTYLSRFIPTLKDAMNGFAEMITELAPLVSEYLPQFIEDTLPDMISAGVSIGAGLVKGIGTLLFKTDWRKVFRETGSKLRTSFASMLDLDADANWGQIRAALATKIKNGLGEIKVSIAKWVGLVPEDGEASPDSVSWGAVALALGDKIWSELNGRVKFTIAKWVGLVDETTEYSADTAGDLKWADIAPKLGGAIGDAILGFSDFIKFTLAKATGVIDDTTVYSAETAGDIAWADVLVGIADSALGFIKTAGSVIKVTLAKLTGVISRNTEVTPELMAGLTWGEIFAKLGNSISGGVDKFKVWLYKVVFHLDRNTEVEADDITWQTIANQMATKIGQFAQNFVGSLLGLDNMTDADWGQIAGQILKGIGNAVVGSNEFFKRLFMGDAYDKWVTEHEGNAPSWKEIVDDAWDGLKEGFGDKKLFGDLINVGLDTFEGFSTFITNLIDSILEYLGKDGNTARIVNKVVDIVKGVMDAAPGMIDSITNFVSQFIKAITSPDNVNKILEGFLGIIDALVDNSSEITQAIWEGIFNLLSNPKLIEAIGHLFWQMLFQLPNEIGRGTFKGILEGLGIPSGWVDTVFDFTGLKWLTPGGGKEGLGSSVHTTESGRTAGGSVGHVFVSGVTGVNSLPEEARQAIVNADEANLDNVYANGADVTANGAIVYADGTIYVPSISVPWDTHDSGYTVFHPDGTTTYAKKAPRNANAHGGVVYTQNRPAENAKGLWNVPYDDYLASLHRDEMVLTASQARDFREGYGGNLDVVEAINALRNDMQNLRLVVGQKVFGDAVVDYSGQRMQGYIGRAEQRSAAGYGWG